MYYRKRWGHFIGLIYVFLSALLASGSEPKLPGGADHVRILVLDSPVDLTHPSIKPFVDFEAMHKLPAKVHSEGEVSWFRWNEIAKQGYEKFFEEMP